MTVIRYEQKDPVSCVSAIGHLGRDSLASPFILFYFKIFIYLAAPGLSCGMRDLVP